MSLAVALGRRLPPNLRRLLNLARGIDTPRLADRPGPGPVVVLAPHPDDELLGCGGTLVKHRSAGDTVHVAFVTSGERTVGLAGADKSRREVEAAAAMDALDLNYSFLRYPDGGVGADAQPEVAVEALLAERRPRLVYAPFPVDAHRDHVATTRLLATRLPASVESVALYEVWTPLYPNTVVDVTDTIEAKLEALACYESALTSVDYLHTARGLAAYRAAQGLSGRGYAEAFVVVSPSGLRDLLGHLA